MMVTVLLGLIGLIVGLALDTAIVQLAVAPDDDDVLDEGSEEEPEGGRAPRLHAEAGSLVLEAEESWRDWARRLLVVGATAGLFAAAGARYSEPSHLAVVTAWLSVFVICTGTDLLSYRVPNAVTYPAIAGAIVVGLLMPGADIIEVLAGGLLAGGVLFFPAILTGGRGMGMGDVKLATFTGLALGFTLVVPALVIMGVAGGAVAAALLVTGARKRGQAIAYAPFIAIGGVASLLWFGASFERLL